MSEFFNQASRLGFALSPLAPNSKLPISDEMHPKRYSSRDAADWKLWHEAGYNFALWARSNGLIGVDVDPRHGGLESWNAWQAANGHFPPAWLTQSGGAHILFRAPENADLTQRKLADGIDTRVDGYLVCPPSSIDGRRYFVASQGLPIIHKAPAALIESCTRKQIERTASYVAGELDAADVSKMLDFLVHQGEFADYAQWFSVGMALKLEYGDSGIDLWRLTHNDTVTADVEESKWRSFANEAKPDSVTLNSFMKRAHDCGWRGQIGKSMGAMFGAAVVPAQGQSIANTLVGPRGEILPFDADETLAMDFASRHVDRLRYNAERGHWLLWDGVHWQVDKIARVTYLARDFLREIAVTIPFQEAKKVASAQKVGAVEKMVRCDPRIVTTASMWDADPWLLGTPAGTIDLRTGKMRPASPADHITKITAAAPNANGCPRWLEFLHQVLGGDDEMVAFLQRALGYSLTGITSEHQMFFPHGGGGNGKGVMLNTVIALMGDYARTALAETFLASHTERHPTDVAALAGARLVGASEAPEGRYWDETKIKSLTGGDRQTARFMRQDFFEFVPEFKLWFVANHRPRLRTVDEAIRRRLNLIEFKVTIPSDKRDPQLSEKLKAEWGAILQWMIDGCLAWQRAGLQPPKSVQAATNDYLASEDDIGSWLEECCDTTDATAWAPRDSLFMSWSGWSTRTGERNRSRKAFLESLRTRFDEAGRVGVRGFRGVRLKLQPPMPAAHEGVQPNA